MKKIYNKLFILTFLMLFIGLNSVKALGEGSVCEHYPDPFYLTYSTGIINKGANDTFDTVKHNILQYNGAYTPGILKKNGAYEASPIYQYDFVKFRYNDRNSGNELYASNIDPGKAILKNNSANVTNVDKWWCTRELDPTNYDPVGKYENVRRFDLAMYYLYGFIGDNNTYAAIMKRENADKEADNIVAELATRFLAYYYDVGQLDDYAVDCGTNGEKALCNTSPNISYYKRHEAFMDFRKLYGNYTVQQHATPNFDCSKKSYALDSESGWIFCSDPTIPHTGYDDYLKTAFQMFQTAHKYADDVYFLKLNPAEIKSKFVDRTGNEVDDSYWTFTQNGSNTSSKKSDGSYTVSNYELSNFEAKTTYVLSYDNGIITIDDNAIPTIDCSDKNDNNSKFTCEIEETRRTTDKDKNTTKITYTITIKGDISNYAGKKYTGYISIPYINKNDNNRLLVLNQNANVATDEVLVNSARMIVNFTGGAATKNYNFEFQFPYLANQCLIEGDSSNYKYKLNGKQVSAQNFFSNGCCSTYENSKYFEEDNYAYKEYCAGSCKTENSLATQCSNSYSTSTITGPSNPYTCFIQKEKEATDENGNSYVLKGFKNNNYCTVYCKEDYKFNYNLSKRDTAKAYNYLYKNRKYLVKISGTMTCYEKVDSDKISDEDLDNEIEEFVEYYNLYNVLNKVFSSTGKSCDKGRYCVIYNDIEYDECSYNKRSNNISCSKKTDDFDIYYYMGMGKQHIAGDGKLNNILKGSEYDAVVADLEVLRDYFDGKVFGYENITDNYTGSLNYLKNLKTQATSCVDWANDYISDENNDGETKGIIMPDVTYEYEDDYFDVIKNKTDLMDKQTTQNTVKLWECNAPLDTRSVEMRFSSCTNGSLEEKEYTDNSYKIKHDLYLENLKNIDCTNCATDFSSISDIKIIKNNYVKLTQNTTALYSPTKYFTIKNDKPTLADSTTTEEDLIDGLPVSADVENGSEHYFKLHIDNLGKFYDTNETGRLISNKNNAIQESYEYVCTYTISDVNERDTGDGPCKKGSYTVEDASGETCCSDVYYANNYKCEKKPCASKKTDRYGQECCIELYNEKTRECSDTTKEKLTCCKDSYYDYYKINNRYYRTSKNYYSPIEINYSNYAKSCDVDLIKENNTCGICELSMDKNGACCDNKECCKDDAPLCNFNTSSDSSDDCATNIYATDSKNNVCCSTDLKVDKSGKSCCKDNYDESSNVCKNDNDDSLEVCPSCEVGCVSSLACTYSSTKTDLNVKFSVVSLNNPSPNGINKYSTYFNSYKYDKMQEQITKKAKQSGEEYTYSKEPEYSFTLDANAIENIRKSNQDTELNCMDIAVSYNESGDVIDWRKANESDKNNPDLVIYKKAICTSEFLNEIGKYVSNYKYETNEKLKFNLWLNNCNVNNKSNCHIAEGVGPSWK